MPNGFRWKDEAISDDEYARRRELIRRLWHRAESAITQTQAALHVLRLPVNDGLDDDAYDAAMLRYTMQHATLLTTEQVHRGCQRFLHELFGQHEVEHALDEGQGRIGSLPYAKD